MVQYFKAFFSGHITLELFDTLVLEFDDRTAFCADQVVVVGIRGGVFVPRKAVLKTAFLCHPCLGQELQGAVHGSITDAGMSSLHQGMEFLGTQVTARFNKDIQYFVSLAGRPETLPGHVFGELESGFFLHILHILILKTVFNNWVVYTMCRRWCQDVFPSPDKIKEAVL
jgi:hypothetical protein